MHLPSDAVGTVLDTVSERIDGADRKRQVPSKGSFFQPASGVAEGSPLYCDLRASLVNQND